MHLRGYAAAPLPPAAFLGHLSCLSSSLRVFTCHLLPLLLFLGTSESLSDENPLRKGCVETPTLLAWTFRHPHTSWGEYSLAQAAQQPPLLTDFHPVILPLKGFASVAEDGHAKSFPESPS